MTSHDSLPLKTGGWETVLGIVTLVPGIGLRSLVSWIHLGHVGISKNNGTPKSSILIGFSIINHPFWGTPIFGNTHIYIYIYIYK